MDADVPVTAKAGSPVTAVVAIRRYFFAPDAKPVAVLAEIKALTPEDKAELAAGAAVELGVTLAD